MNIIDVIQKVESGWRNVTQGNIGDVNNLRGTLAQGYFQITDPTWAQFGGLATGYTSAIQAPFDTQLQVAENIPIGRWGPATQNALQAAGYSFTPGETLGQLMAKYGQLPGSNLPGPAGSLLSGSQGSVTSMADATTGAQPGGSTGAQPGGSTGAQPGGSSGSAWNSGGGTPITPTNIGAAGQIGLEKAAEATKAAGESVKTGTEELNKGIAQDTQQAVKAGNSWFDLLSNILVGPGQFIARVGVGILAILLIAAGLWFIVERKAA
jgi:hypothetical protein